MTVLGSTPRMRGIYLRHLMLYCLGRFNPAYAGNMQPLPPTWYISQVQPRVCGEYLKFSPSKRTWLGSTPRMRGILIYFRLKTDFLRFNPAYAGNIHITPASNAQRKVQPRVCGEYRTTYPGKQSAAGSTPRMRGILSPSMFASLQVRFNPAYAGNILKRS